jgi:hypothetical protein
MYLAFSKCIPKTLERPGVQENAEKKQADLLPKQNNGWNTCSWVTDRWWQLAESQKNMIGS